MASPHSDKCVVLLNPPSSSVVLRDYFCSKSSQAGYLNPPVDFVVQSGLLAEHFNVRVVDAVASRIGADKCIEQVRALKPHAVYALTGFISWREDMRFFQRLNTDKLILSGDIFLENPERRMSENPFIDSILLNFTTPALAKYLLGDSSARQGLVTRSEDGEIIPAEPAGTGNEFSIPVPLHELFIRLPYRYPFVMGRPFASVLTEYGCPFKCGFCIMGALGLKRRPLHEVEAELKHLQSLGVRDIFFLDQTFGSDRRRLTGMLDILRSFKTKFRWLCFSRADCAAPDVVRDMKQAGCHTIIYGIESSADAVLAEYGKRYTWAQVSNALSAAKSAGVRTVGTLLFGLPGDSPENCLGTIRDVKAAGCDYISINIAVPRMGTPMRDKALSLGIIGPALDRMDQSGSFIAMEHGGFSAQTLISLKRRAIREFYLDPSYIVRRLASVRSPAQLAIEAGQAYSLMRNIVRQR